MGTPNFTDNALTIPLLRRDGSVRAVVVVDAEDYETVVAQGPWRIVSKGYVAAHDRSRRGSAIYLHRFLLGVTNPAVQVDHIDGDPLNCRRSNLRLATNAQNAQNKKPVGGSSQYRGVAWHPASGKWMAYAQVQRKRTHLGLFDQEEEAAEAAAQFRAKQMPYSKEALV